ncbi:MAG: formylmethanofuran dehydrogenase subunit A [Planctomycetota bacterium]
MTDQPRLIQNVRIVDPASGTDCVGALGMADGRIVDAKTLVGQPHVEVIDASGMVAMAGGIDLHTHIGGGKLTIARMLLGDAPEVQADHFLPTVSQTAERYLDMGYTTCFEPAMLPSNARAAHSEMVDVRGLDTGGYCLLGNDETLLSMIADDVPQGLINDYVAFMVRATRAMAVKVVNPGGIDAFKYNVRSFDVDSRHPRYNITPGDIIRRLCRAVHEIGLVHPLHVHASNLGVPGNIESTLATIKAADGLPIHLTHVQFHSYASTGDEEGHSALGSAADRLVDAMRKNPNVTVDVGQVMFGQTVTISADAMHQTANLKFANPKRSMILAIECEAGCGVVPFRYRRKNFVNAMQWAIGLELFLMIDDPSRVFLTTDHPNGGPMTTYPHLIRLLGDRSFRETALSEIHPDAAASCSLRGLEREYSLSDIASMTRSGPAAVLGLSDRGTLAPGKIADVTIYRGQADWEAMFSRPEYVFRRGNLVRRAGRTVASEMTSDSTLIAPVEFDPRSIPIIRERYEATSTHGLDRLWIHEEEIGEGFRCETGTVRERVQ